MRHPRHRTAVMVLGLVLALLVGAGPTTEVAAVASGASAQAGPQPTEARQQAREQARERTRPNVLVIETDDMRADELRWMPRTRALVARQGLVLESSFAPTPQCCPSRASFLTGRYAHNHHVYSYASPYGFASFDDRVTLATRLQGVGYRTAMVGKYLNGYGYQPLRWFHGRSGADSSDYVPPGWTHWMGALDQGMAESGDERSTRRGGTYQYFRFTQDVDGTQSTSRGYSTAVTARQVRGVVDDFSRSSQPWFVWWTPVAPHHGGPSEPDDPRRVVDPTGRRVGVPTPARPAWVEGRFDRLIPRAPGVRRNGTTEADISDKPRWMQRGELTRSERRAARASARQRAEALHVLDRQIDATLTRLRRTPAGRNTVVVVTSDNGYYLGEHRRVQGKSTLLEPSLRVPLVMSGPGVPVGVRYDPVSNVDLAPTIARLAGTTVPDADGVDLWPVVRRGDRGWDRPVIISSAVGTPTPGAGPLTMRGLRLGRWKVIRHADGEVELYDLRADPLELRNVADRPRQRVVRRQLLALLARREDCAGASCAAPLPRRFRMTPREVREVVRGERRAAREYYG